MCVSETLLCRRLADGNSFGWSWLSVLTTAVSLLTIGGMFTTASLGQTPKVARTASPTPLPSPPIIEFQAVPATELVERGQQTPVFLLISNRSDKSVTVSTVVLSSSSFTADPLVINTDLPAFRSLQKELVIRARDNSAFGASKSVLSLEYSWDLAGASASSIQRASLSMGVRRRFDEEAKGLPGGTAAFLYLLLPILPGLLSYQLINRRRLNEGWNMPTLGSDQIVPAFFMAVVFSFLVLLIARSDYEINYSEPAVFTVILILSAAAGAAIPAVRWLIDAIRWRVSGFSETDDGKTYLLKALRQRRGTEKFTWTAGKVGGETWQGIRLKQPDGTLVLGATLQIARTEKLSAEEWNKTKAKIFRKDKGLDRVYLWQMLKAGMIDVGKMDKVKAGSAFRDEFVVVAAVRGFQDSGAVEEKDLLRPSN